MTYPVFATGDVLNASDMNGVGLWLVKSQAVGTGVSSVSVTGAFSADYDRYMIQISGVRSTVSAPNLIMTVPGISSPAYFSSFMFQLATSATVSTANVPTGAAFYLGNLGNQSSFIQIDGLDPNNTLGHSATFRYSSYDSSASYAGTGGIWSTSGATFTQFTLSASSGNLTGGTIRVYGYRN
jgi:hypothetical protein